MFEGQGPLQLRGGGIVSRRQGLSKSADRAISTAILSIDCFKKVNLYANSKLPAALPPLQLNQPAYPLLCLAAQYSQRAYSKPEGNEREAFVNASWGLGLGSKAMVIKSVPVDDMNCIVFAIRGSQTFMDWSVNLNTEPTSPTDFLDDLGNLVHSGFLSVARRMIKPVAARLRHLLEEDPSRTTSSLLLTGHSAGGAIASLLYAHMLSQVAQSELTLLTDCFKRVHCVTFGSPPTSLLPLQKPSGPRHHRSLFLSFINEGDPVPRADKAYVRSLIHLYASAPPGSTRAIDRIPAKSSFFMSKKPKALPVQPPADWVWRWNVPAGTLSNAGRLVALREPPLKGWANTEDVVAEITCDQELREVVFGDPMMHMMSLYAKRVEILATKAVAACILT